MYLCIHIFVHCDNPNTYIYIMSCLLSKFHSRFFLRKVRLYILKHNMQWSFYIELFINYLYFKSPNTKLFINYWINNRNHFQSNSPTKTWQRHCLYHKGHRQMDRGKLSSVKLRGKLRERITECSLGNLGENSWMK